MLYREIMAVCSDIRTKHSTQSEHHVELLNVKLAAVNKPLGFKRLTLPLQQYKSQYCFENKQHPGSSAALPTKAAICRRWR